MRYLIKNATLIHRGHKYDGKKIDIIVENGIIGKIATKITAEPKDEIIKGVDLYVSLGFCDIGTHSGEPGFEHRETIESLCKAALAGGYTELAVFPNTKPVIQTKAEVKYLQENALTHGVKIHAIGALSKDTKGVDIAEYYDMYNAGVVAFSDGMHSINDNGLLSRAMQYANQLNVPIINHPYDQSLGGGEMHEGLTSTSLGMKGSPDIAEATVIMRNQMITEYTQGRMIEHCVSSARGLSLIKAFRRKYQNYFSTVSYMNLIHTDKDLEGFDSNLKVKPVIRSKTDRKALVTGIIEQTIDAIVTNHTPLDPESKDLEFQYATPGAIGLETCLAATVSMLSKELHVATIVNKLTIGPRSILGLNIPKIEIGERANLCVFDAYEDVVFKPEKLNSISKNSPYLGKKLRCKVVKVFC
jgi:dihydroorotase